MDNITDVKISIIAFIGALTGLWGWLGWLVVGWVACMVLDYVTGSMAAAKAGEWSSAVAREGIWHKLGMVVVVIVAAGADLLLSIVLGHLPILDLPIQYPGLICPVVLVWYIITELGSIAENGAAMGGPVPAWLLRMLAISREAVDRAGEGLTGGDDNNNNNDNNERSRKNEG